MPAPPKLRNCPDCGPKPEAMFDENPNGTLRSRCVDCWPDYWARKGKHQADYRIRLGIKVRMGKAPFWLEKAENLNKTADKNGQSPYCRGADLEAICRAQEGRCFCCDASLLVGSINQHSPRYLMFHRVRPEEWTTDNLVATCRRCYQVLLQMPLEALQQAAYRLVQQAFWQSLPPEAPSLKPCSRCAGPRDRADHTYCGACRRAYAKQRLDKDPDAKAKKRASDNARIKQRYHNDPAFKEAKRLYDQERTRKKAAERQASKGVEA